MKNQQVAVLGEIRVRFDFTSFISNFKSKSIPIPMKRISLIVQQKKKVSEQRRERRRILLIIDGHNQFVSMTIPSMLSRCNYVNYANYNNIYNKIRE